jgi:transposase
MEQSVIGIDVAKDSLDAFLINGSQQAYKQFANDLGGYRHLLAWLKYKQAERAHACLEATGQYSDGVAEHLYEQGLAGQCHQPGNVSRPMVAASYSATKPIKLTQS